MFSREVAELEGLIKQQLLAAMFLGVSLTESDDMSLPYFKLITRVGREIQQEMSKENQGSLPQGTIGRARMY